MASYFRSTKDGGGCCDCAAQPTPCSGCKDCAEDVPCKLETRTRENYGSKCGVLHPFVERPQRYFRSVSVEFYVKWQVMDAVSTPGTDEEAGLYNSRCSISAHYVDACAGTAEVTVDSSRETNFWSGAPVVGSGETDKQNGVSTFTGGEPWIRFSEATDCWSADQIFARSEPGQPSRYSSGIPVAGIITSNYDFNDVGSVVIPPATMIRKTANGGEVWARVNGSLGAEADGWAYTLTKTMEADTAQILAVRSASGKSIVTLEDEYTTAELKANVRAGITATAWGGLDLCCHEELSDYEVSYAYRELQFRFKYDYARRVRIGYKIFRIGQGADAEVQYVDSPEDRVFTLFPSDGGDMCVNLVSCTACL